MEKTQFVQGADEAMCTELRAGVHTVDAQLSQLQQSRQTLKALLGQDQGGQP
eukprot:CAMPEP_0202894818 /NCGR_PEP_ID=MMETSP1392-20130828/4128_1 /ASSEMBLY_ACC=CAM_ASM_000868 /TAXON_ID=225041 /ORGANISM="Chlamydomonas chlamydogama, Strain SAG 11-48b" /LENGTH=51 /DNA_ID=CAMNT_0049579621 /DNA_START=1150 /DNA_END=1305 /DNA_ORIENTATION=+